MVDEQKSQLLISEDDKPELGNSNGISLVEKSTISKLNTRIFLLCTGIIYCSLVDRASVGLAANDVCEDLKLTHKDYGTGVGAYYLGYFSSQLLSNIFLKRYGAPKWLSSMLVTRGIIAAGLAFTQSAVQFYILRSLGGFATGGTFPGVWYHLTLFYPDNYLSKVYGLSVAALYLIFPLTAPLATGIMLLDGFKDIDGWRYLFFCEGILSVCYATIVFAFLPESVQTASFLSSEEKAWVVSELNVDEETTAEEFNVMAAIKLVVRTSLFWIWATVSFVVYSVAHILDFWITLIIKDMLDEGKDEDEESETCGSSGKHRTAAILLSAIPYILGSIFCYTAGRLFPTFKNKARAIGCLIIIAGLILLSWIFSKGVFFGFGFLSLTLAVALVPAVVGPYTAIVATLFDQSIRSIALPMFNTMGNLGSVCLPPLIGLLVDAYGYSAGILSLAGATILAGLLSIKISMTSSLMQATSAE